MSPSGTQLTLAITGEQLWKFKGTLLPIYHHYSIRSQRTASGMTSTHSGTLHKQGRYFIVHFKELFALDGKKANLSLNDVQRRNRIVQLLGDWGLVSINSKESIADVAPLSQIKVLAYREKGDWTLESKYNIGKKKEE